MKLTKIDKKYVKQSGVNKKKFIEYFVILELIKLELKVTWLIC